MNPYNLLLSLPFFFFYLVIRNALPSTYTHILCTIPLHMRNRTTPKMLPRLKCIEFERKEKQALLRSKLAGSTDHYPQLK